jgi:PAS domain S-box-containing protein
MNISENDLAIPSMMALEHLPEAVLWFDKNAQFVKVNQKACDIWGYTEKEFLSMSIFDVNTKMVKSAWPEHWKKKQKDPSTFEGIHRKKDGTLFPVDITDIFVPINGELFCCAIVRDISERKELNRIARLSDFTIQHANDTIFWLDADGNILNTNGYALFKYGYTREEMKSNTIYDLNPNLNKEGFREMWKNLQTQKRLFLETTHTTKDGRKIEVEISANYLSFEDEEYTASIVRDITLRKRRESALRGALLEIKELKEKLEAEKNYLAEEIEIKNDFGEIITDSDLYKKVLQQVEQVSITKSTVLITGESGTGKELIARAVHRLSDRSDTSLIKVDCTALPGHMIESELFGHEKGAFPGATKRKVGKFELANNGTLFLDEVGEIPIELQSKLLRVLQEGEFERLGGTSPVKIDVRIIAATNKLLADEIENGNFREDLFYRLNVFRIESVPLRKRKEDIPLLVKHFAEKLGIKMGKRIKDVPQRIIKKLMAYDFPGNVRELENLIERGVITSVNGRLNLHDFDPKKQEVKSKDYVTMKEFQKQYIVDILKHTQWRVSGPKGAAVILGIPATTLYSKMDKLGIKRSLEVQAK